MAPTPVGVRETERREAELILMCARLRLGPKGRLRLVELLDEPLDWAEVLHWAGCHHTTSLLYHHLSRTDGGRVPEEVLQQLRSRYLAITARNMKLVRELATLSEELERAGAPAVAWKGPVLAHTVYPSPELRTFADLDIIVRPADRHRVREVLNRRGYRASPTVSLTEEEMFSRKSQDATMQDPETHVMLDVHWGVVPRYRTSVADFEMLWSRHEMMELGGSVIRVLEPGTHLLALCAHGAKHRPFPWPALKWVTDVEAFVRSLPPDAWPPLLARSRALGCHRMLLLGLLLVREVLGKPLPPSVAEDLSGEPGLAGLATSIRDRFVRPEGATFSLGDRIKFDLAVRERRRDRIAYRADRLFTPTRHDTTKFPTPFRLLLVPLRLVRLARKYILRPSRVRTLLEGSDPGRDG
jgi:hypothetical protein